MEEISEISAGFETRTEHDTKTLHFRIIRFMFEAGTKLRMTSLPLATAATLYHRFFHHFSEDDFDPHMIAVTALYLAGKVEEEHVRLTDVINVSYRILHRNKPPLDIDTTYWSLRDSIIQCELFVARALQFQFAVDHPHKYLVHFLKSLYDWIDRRCTRQTPIASTAWALLCDSYHGNLCLSHQPDVIAVAVLHATLQCYGVSVPPQDDEDTRLQWWQIFVDGVQWREIKNVINELLDLYGLETTTNITSLSS